MLNIIKDKWDQNQEKLREVLAANTQLNHCCYLDLVKLSFGIIYNTGEDGSQELDLEGIIEIDGGDYQGTLVYLIPFKTYQPSESDYLMTYVGYGSCSGCDTLQAIQGYSDEPPTEDQLRDYVTLCKDILTNTIKPYNEGWRKDNKFDQAEMN